MFSFRPIRARLVRMSCGAALFFALAAFGATAEEKTKPFNTAEARAVLTSMDGEPALAAYYQSCPAEVFRKEASLREPLREPREATAEECGAKPSECFRLCTLSRSSTHCFNLALAFQGREQDIAPRYAQMLYSMTCAIGQASGCTNRAASVRNAELKDDPLQRQGEDARRSCEFRSFKIACEKDDAWGCAMLGQSYHLGEGAPADRDLARQAYDKSCKIDPNFDACEFAKTGLAELKSK